MADEALIKAAAELARTAPETWGRFVAAFEVHNDTQRDQVVQSPLDTLQGAQGRARESAHLLKLLKDCVATADKLKEVRK